MADGKGSRQDTEDRKARLAAELRANLLRRKEQTRSRRAGEADSRREGIPTGPTPEEPK